MNGEEARRNGCIFGDRLAMLRRDVGLTQLDLASRANVSISTVYRAERSDPSVGPRIASRLALALAVETESIYDGEVLAVANQPVSASRAEQQHDEVVERLDRIQQSVDELDITT